MDKKFKSFADFGQTVKEEQAEGFRQKADDIFEKSIKDDFDSIPEGSFKSSLPEISWIAFARPKDRKTGEANSSILNAVVFTKNEFGKDTNHIWTISRNGILKPTQKIPANLANKYSQEEISFEIASLLERIGPSFIHFTDLPIIPSQDDSGDKEKPISIDVHIGGVEKPIDPEREEFLRSLKDAKFMSANRGKGLKGYVIVFFDNKDFILIENQYRDNAAFIMDLPERVDMKAIEDGIRNQKTVEDGEGQKVSKDELRTAVEQRYWEPISKEVRTRQDLLMKGAKRYIHKPGVWQQEMREAIASRTP